MENSHLSQSIPLLVLWSWVWFTHISFWMCGRILAGTDEREKINKRKISDKMKRILFLFPLIKMQTFTLHTMAFMLFLHVSTLFQMLILTAKAIGMDVNIEIYPYYTLFTGFMFFACSFISMFYSAKRKWRIWREKRKQQK